MWGVGCPLTTLLYDRHTTVNTPPSSPGPVRLRGPSGSSASCDAGKRQQSLNFQCVQCTVETHCSLTKNSPASVPPGIRAKVAHIDHRLELSERARRCRRSHRTASTVAFELHISYHALSATAQLSLSRVSLPAPSLVDRHGELGTPRRALGRTAYVIKRPIKSGAKCA